MLTINVFTTILWEKPALVNCLVSKHKFPRITVLDETALR